MQKNIEYIQKKGLAGLIRPLILALLIAVPSSGCNSLFDDVDHEIIPSLGTQKEIDEFRDEMKKIWGNPYYKGPLRDHTKTPDPEDCKRWREKVDNKGTGITLRELMIKWLKNCWTKI